MERKDFKTNSSEIVRTNRHKLLRKVEPNCIKLHYNIIEYQSNVKRSKIMKSQFINISLIVLVIMSSCTLTKTAPETISEITHKIESKDFTVAVNYANPFRRRPVYLTSEYDLQIKNDSAFAYLPYFGVAYVAPFNSSEGGIKFAEPMSNYSITPNKKSNGWDIRFKIKSKVSVYDIFMNVFNNGSTTFTVSSYERDMITFNGDVKK